MRSMTRQPTTDRTDGTHACPLCDHRGETANDIYVHLQVSHRKSEMSEALIESITDERAPSVEQ